MFGYVAHHTHVKTFQKRHTFFETLAEVNLSTHGALCDGFHLVAHAGTHRQLIDHLGLNQGGIHIETNQSTHTAVHVVVLE